MCSPTPRSTAICPCRQGPIPAAPPPGFRSTRNPPDVMTRNPQPNPGPGSSAQAGMFVPERASLSTTTPESPSRRASHSPNRSASRSPSRLSGHHTDLHGGTSPDNSRSSQYEPSRSAAAIQPQPRTVPVRPPPVRHRPPRSSAVLLPLILAIARSPLWGLALGRAIARMRGSKQLP